MARESMARYGRGMSRMRSPIRGRSGGCSANTVGWEQGRGCGCERCLNEKGDYIGAKGGARVGRGGFVVRTDVGHWDYRVEDRKRPVAWTKSRIARRVGSCISSWSKRRGRC